MSAIPVLLFINILGFLFSLIADETNVSSLALWPWHEGFMPWQLLTYAFLHANVMHLAFNMFGLWMFGRDLEFTLGTKTLYQIYFASVLAAGIAQLIFALFSGSTYPTVGASGGVFGLLLGYGMCFPKRTVVLLFPPIPMPAWLFVTLYAALELFMGVTGTQVGVAHFAHLGGMVGAYLVMRQRLRR